MGAGAGRKAPRYEKKVKAIIYGIALNIVGSDEKLEEDKGWASHKLTAAILLSKAEENWPGWAARRMEKTGKDKKGVARDLHNRLFRYWNTERKIARQLKIVETSRGKRSKEHPKNWPDWADYEDIVDRVRKGIYRAY